MGRSSDDVRAQSYLTIVARHLDSDAAFAAVCAGTQAINQTVRECAEHAWNELFPGRQPDPA